MGRAYTNVCQMCTHTCLAFDIAYSLPLYKWRGKVKRHISHRTSKEAHFGNENQINFDQQYHVNTDHDYVILQHINKKASAWKRNIKTLFQITHTHNSVISYGGLMFWCTEPVLLQTGRGFKENIPVNGSKRRSWLTQKKGITEITEKNKPVLNPKSLQPLWFK